MKVTKRIEEFIRVELQKKMENDPKLLAKKAAAEREAEDWEEAIKQLKKETQVKLDALGAKFGYSYDALSGIKTAPIVDRFQNSNISYLPLQREYNYYQRELQRKCYDTMNDILISMELGGTKDELMEMISKVEF